MKIYEPTTYYVIRLQIKRKDEKPEYLTLFETSMEEVKTFLQDILKPHVHPFPEGNRTSIYIREATGAKNGKNTSISFFGLSAKETLQIIRDNCEKP